MMDRGSTHDSVIIVCEVVTWSMGVLVADTICSVVVDNSVGSDEDIARLGSNDDSSRLGSAIMTLDGNVLMVVGSNDDMIGLGLGSAISTTELLISSDMVGTTEDGISSTELERTGTIVGSGTVGGTARLGSTASIIELDRGTAGSFKIVDSTDTVGLGSALAITGGTAENKGLGSATTEVGTGTTTSKVGSTTSIKLEGSCITKLEVGTKLGSIVDNNTDELEERYSGGI
jgi:hypothetical protein